LSGANTIHLKNKSRPAIKTVLHADDKVLITKSEDGLQVAAHQLNNIAKK
jgi:hypothetical protein